MGRKETQVPDQTMKEAAEELHAAVLALKELIEREYPSRKEVERRFQSKQNAQVRLTFVILVICISFVLSFFAIIGTISTCFLGDAASSPSACGVLPGYSDTEKKNQDLLQQFEELIKITTRNDHRLDKLEQKNPH
jgi:hypothetical protein